MRPNADNTVAVIVTYHPEGNFEERVARISSQVRHTVIIDNGSSPTEIESIGNVCRALSTVESAFNVRNLGIATALNQGIRRALELGGQWIVTFDQDSVPVPYLLDAFAVIYDSYPEPEKIGVIGCNFRDSRTGMNAVAHSPGTLWRKAEAVITSGSIFPVRAIKKAGVFRDDFFIDFVDHEFCFRLQRYGFDVLQSSAPLLEHTLGAATIVNGLGSQRLVLRHAGPLRRYFVARNALLTARCYFFQHVRWFVRHLSGIFLVDPLIRIPLEKQNTARKLFAVLLGTLDAIRGKTGFPDYRVLLKL